MTDPQKPNQPPERRPSNQVGQAQFTLEQLKKTAVSRGIPLEKLIAQMVEQYLAEPNTENHTKD